MAKNTNNIPIKDGVKADNSTYSSNKIHGIINTATGNIIDDTSEGSDDSTYSSNKILELLENISNVENLFNKTGIYSDEYIKSEDGSIDSYNGWTRTGYIEIKPDVNYILVNGGGGFSNYNAFYDADHTFISSLSIPSGSSNIGLKDITSLIPSNAKYMAFSAVDSTFFLSGLFNDLPLTSDS